MRRSHLTLLVALSVLPTLVAAATSLDANTQTSVVFIANYNDDNTFLGWGSGFFVDEGIVVTNKHVIEAGDWYRVYATSVKNEVDLTCRKNITKSDVKINLDDDVAYMRVFLPCDHGIVRFAEDPSDGDPAWVLGYPYRESVSKSLTLVATSGSVTGRSELGWMRTDAPLDLGNSGGPVVNDAGVIGVAVAKGIGENGEFVTSYFIQASVIESGLLYANDSRFGYTPQTSKSSLSRSSSSKSSNVSVATSSRRPETGSQSSPFSRSSGLRSQASSSVRSVSPHSFEGRTCIRVLHWFKNNRTMLDRVNARLRKRFGFECR